MAYKAHVYNPGCLVVVLVLASAFLYVKIFVTLFRVYVGMVTCFGALLCWGGNVTFLVYTGFPLYCWCQCGILDHYRYSTNHVYLHRPNAFGFWQMRLHLCYETLKRISNFSELA